MGVATRMSGWRCGPTKHVGGVVGVVSALVGVAIMYAARHLTTRCLLEVFGGDVGRLRVSVSAEVNRVP